MAHTIQEKKKLLNRIRRIRGQVEAVENALVEELDCSYVLQRITACRGAINGLMAQVLEGHINIHVIDPKRKPNASQLSAAKEVVQLIKTYLK